ncbi:hypothetical protein JRI60_05875 [Archangium violaceum]|uniref:hypothetical protein n=1 Tax=Archangium violaceum TaxID=83451 RepID=UPI0019529B36|nr:hypothetical protein [Archangium violaceum]QRN98571.1 hypothetical protein JRI60_05875 [Archangium violaceum]
MRHRSLVPLLIAAALCIAALVLMWLRPIQLEAARGAAAQSAQEPSRLELRRK